jgi:hypothetical protein
MTKEEFIKVLDEKRYSYEKRGNKIVVTGGYIGLNSLTSLPPGVVFNNGWAVNLTSLTSLPPDVEFRNKESVYLDSLTSLPPGVVFRNGGFISLSSLTGDYFNRWEGNIKGIDNKRLLNLMIKQGVFER